jgi:hypothetical protein
MGASSDGGRRRCKEGGRWIGEAVEQGGSDGEELEESGGVEARGEEEKNGELF